MQVSFEIRGTNRVRNQLRAIATYHPNKSDKIIGVHAKKERARLKSLGEPTPNTAKQVWKSAKQRRWFFWALAEGIVTVPYRRTGKLPNSYRATRKAPGVWEITNSREGAAFVIKKGMQNKRFHENRWYTLEDEVEKNISELSRELSAALESELNGIS